MKASLLHYRQWRGTFHRPIVAVWPIARLALALLFRRKLFWVLYAVSLIIFLMFFFGSYLLDWAIAQIPQTEIQIGDFRPDTRRAIEELQASIPFFNGSNQTFEFFFLFQSSMVVVTLALIGSVLVGSDYVHGSVPFYLAKPISRWHYVLGKCLAVAIIINLLTTVPALVLFFQKSLGDVQYFTNPDFFRESGRGGPAGLPLLSGIIGYGLLLGAVLSILLVAMASWLRRTMPLVMVWTAMFIFLRIIANVLVNRLQYDEHWRLLDLWNNLRLVGCTFLGFASEDIFPQPQPASIEAGLALVVVAAAAIFYLHFRTRAVEIIK